ncbi:MAG: hypothetical protein ACFFED_05160 [Candidatus Thorarchaeota archaeon]
MTARKEILIFLGFVVVFWIIANVIVSFVTWMNLFLFNEYNDLTEFIPNLFFIFVFLLVLDTLMDKYESWKEEKEAGAEAPVN